MSENYKHYLRPGAFVPIDMNTTSELLRGLKELEQQRDALLLALKDYIHAIAIGADIDKRTIMGGMLRKADSNARQLIAEIEGQP